MSPGDHLVYDAPREKMRAGEVVQAFVALGTILAGEPYQIEATDGSRPYRRQVRFPRGRDASIRPLREQLSFTRHRDN